MFWRFQIELTKSHKLNSKKVHELSTSDSKNYLVFKVMVPKSRRRYFTVVQYIDTGMAKCNFKMFEHSGTICRHIPRLLMSKNLVQIHEELIHKRWTQDANKSSGVASYVLTSVTDYVERQIGQFNHSAKRFLSFVLDASSSKEATRYVYEMLDREEKIVTKILAEGVKIRPGDNVQLVTKAEDAMKLRDDDDVAASNDPVFNPICS